MKKIIALIVLFSILSCRSVSGQIFIGNIKISKSKYLKSPKELKTEDIDKFKATKTYFIYDSEYFAFSKDEYAEALKKVWLVTDYEVIDRVEFLGKVKAGNSVVFFNYDMLKSAGNFMKNEKPAIQSDGEVYTRIQVSIIESIKTNKKNKTTIEYNTYANSHFHAYTANRETMLKYNQGFGHLINTLKFINNKLNNNESYVSWGDFVNANEIKELKEHSLYVSHNEICQCSHLDFPGRENELISHSNKLLKSYDFNATGITKEKLSKLILDDNSEQFFYLTYNQQMNGFRVINIINGKTGNIIYQDYKGAAFSLKEKDFKKLNKTIDKGKI